MKSVFPSLGVVVCAVLVVALAPQLSWADKQAKGAKQAEVVAGEMAAFAKHLHLRPESAIDRTTVSGEYCFDVNTPPSYMPRTVTRIWYGFPSP